MLTKLVAHRMKDTTVLITIRQDDLTVARVSTSKNRCCRCCCCCRRHRRHHSIPTRWIWQILLVGGLFGDDGVLLRTLFACYYTAIHSRREIISIRVEVAQRCIHFFFFIRVVSLAVVMCVCVCMRVLVCIRSVKSHRN